MYLTACVCSRKEAGAETADSVLGNLKVQGMGSLLHSIPAGVDADRFQRDVVQKARESGLLDSWKDQLDTMIFREDGLQDRREDSIADMEKAVHQMLDADDQTLVN